MTSVIATTLSKPIITTSDERFNSMSMKEDVNENSNLSTEDQLSKLPTSDEKEQPSSPVPQNRNVVISPVLQDALGVNEKGKCIRHPSCPILCFAKEKSPTGANNNFGIYKIVSCRICYAEEKSAGIRQGKSFSAVVEQLRNITAAPPANGGENYASSTLNGGSNSELFNLHNSLSASMGDLEQSIGNGLDTVGSNALLNHLNSTTTVLESIMKRLSQVHNWTLRQKEKEIMSLQLHINSLEQQLAVEQTATTEQRNIVKALRRTIQQDLKIIKTMATTQKQREDIEAAAIQTAAVSSSVLDASSTNVSESPIKVTNQIQFENSGEIDVSPIKTVASPESAPVRYFSPSKAYSPPEELSSPEKDKSPKVVNAALHAPPRRASPIRPSTSMAKQARMLERMQSTRSIDEPILEVHDDDENERSTPAMDIVFDASNVVAAPANPDDDKDDDSDDDDEENKIFSTGNYWKEADMRSLKSSKIFQSFRGGLLDIPKSPPKARHDLDDEEDDGVGGNKNNRKNRRKKLQLNTNAMDVLKFPQRGVLSRANSSDEGLPLSVLQAVAAGLDPPAFFQQQKQLQSQGQLQSHPQTPLNLAGGCPLDTPTTANSEGGPNMTVGIGNVVFNKDISLDSLALKLSQLPLSAQTSTSAGKTPEHLLETKVQQHPNMPEMSPLETSVESPYKPCNETKESTTQQKDTTVQPSKATKPSPPSQKDIAELKIPPFMESSTDKSKNKKEISVSVPATNNSTPPPDTTGSKPAASDDATPTSKMSKDKKFVFSVTNAVSRDKFGDEGIYTGDILVTEGLPHGKGRMKYESGRIYDGDWVCGQWHGHGKLLNPNGDTYTGEFFFDSRHGQGTYKWDNGDLYEGAFVSDKRHGKGKFSFHNGNVYTGEFCDGMFEGFGKYEFEGGHYLGEWKAGRYDGSGELVYATGGKYTGEFRNSVAHGFGTEVTADGRVRRGIWHLGKPSEGFDK